ncbi:MAG: SpoIIIAH-like family protein [Clostridia bacterium]|nr:SpoIIIAH-like family protein [Clostridia bacterium]
MKWERIIEGIGFMFSAAAVLAAMFFSWAANDSPAAFEDMSVAASVKTNVFEEFRLERTRVRELETVQLTQLMNDPGVNEETRLEAARALNEMGRQMEAETTIEGILKMRGHEDAVVTVHAGSVNVVLKTGADDKNECAFILDLVLRETGQTAGNVKIIGV